MGLCNRIKNGAMVAVASFAAAAGTPGQARADEFLDQANAFYAPIQKDRRSDLVILPVLHKLQPPPKSVSDYLSAAMMTPANPAWGEVKAWAEGQTQKDAIEALKKVTGEEDWRKAWAFGQPYGAAAVEPEFVDMGLYTELGEDGMLAAAEVKYLPVVHHLESLCHVEATRLLAEGKGNDALDLMRRWAKFAYQIASRHLLKEKQEGMEMLALAFERMRDLAYVDSRSETRSMTAEGVRDVIARLDERNPINIERLLLPEAEKLAAEQLVARTFVADGGPSGEAFARSFARVAAGDRPLRRFSESAKWDAVLKLHGNTAETRRQIRDVFGDWDKRWSLNQWDPIQELATDYTRLDKVRFAALDLVMGDVGTLFPLRRKLRVEWIGTRGALACYGLMLRTGKVPVRMESTVPDFVRNQNLTLDPFDKAAKEGRGSRLGYFRPGVDNMAVGGTPRPHVVRLFPKVAGVEYPNFEAPILEGQFVVFSAGPDGNQGDMARATQMVKDDKGDYLIWPPAISMVRQYLADNARSDADRP